MEYKLFHFNMAFKLFQMAYILESYKENFWVFHNLLWKTLIWDTYRNTLFHDIQNDVSLKYSGLYNTSQLDDQDPLLPLIPYLNKGSLPYYRNCYF